MIVLLLHGLHICGHYHQEYITRSTPPSNVATPGDSDHRSLESCRTCDDSQTTMPHYPTSSGVPVVCCPGNCIHW